MINVVKVNYNPSHININPYKYYDFFRAKVTSEIIRNREVDASRFYSGFKTFADAFKEQEKPQEMDELSKGFIDFLVSKGQDNLAGIAYSLLIKINLNNPKTLEELAIKALKVAQKTNDPIHILARANDLSHLFAKTEAGSEKHIKYLKISKEALTDICENYSTSLQNRFLRISRNLKPLENYELMLCTAKLRIAKYTFATESQNARLELEQAKHLFEKNKKSENRELIEKLAGKIAELEETMK